MAEASQRDLINAALDELCTCLIEQMNQDHIARRVIDKTWARNKLVGLFGGAYKKDKTIALTELIEEYMGKAPGLIKKNKENPLSQNIINNYKTTLSKIKAFEGV